MAAKKAGTSKPSAKPTASQTPAGLKASVKSNDQHPEPGREAVPTYRADMGEGLPDQADTMNANRAK